MMGISSLSATSVCTSRPLMSGRLRSSTRQLGAWTRGSARNSFAEAHNLGCHPALLTSSSNDSRTETSSSTTNTTGVTGNIGNPDRGEVLSSKLMFDLIEMPIQQSPHSGDYQPLNDERTLSFGVVDLSARTQSQL